MRPLPPLVKGEGSDAKILTDADRAGDWRRKGTTDTRVLSRLFSRGPLPSLLIYPPDAFELGSLMIMLARREHFFKKTFLYGGWTQTLPTPYEHTSPEGGRSRDMTKTSPPRPPSAGSTTVQTRARASGRKET